MNKEEQVPKNSEVHFDNVIDTPRTVEVKQASLIHTAQVVTDAAVHAEEIPTIPIGSLQTISTLQPEISVHSVASMRAANLPTPLVVQPEEYRRNMGEWLQIWRDGLRPMYLPLSLMPVLLGSIIAWEPTVKPKNPFGQLQWTHLLGTIIVVILLQLGAQLINDYYDYIRGVDTSNTFAPGGLIQQGLMKPTHVLTYGLTLMGIGTVLGLIVAQRGGVMVYLIGLIILLAAYFYSATARPLSSLGLGELIAFIVFGPLLTISAYLVQTGGHFSNTPFIYSLTTGLLAAAIIHANNMRDMEEDGQAGKTTLATLLGLKVSRLLYIVLTLAPLIIITELGWPHKAPHLILLTLWTLPTLVVAITGVLRTDNPAGFHKVIQQTLNLQTAFTILLMLALIATTLIPVFPRIPEHLFPGL